MAHIEKVIYDPQILFNYPNRTNLYGASRRKISPWLAYPFRIEGRSRFLVSRIFFETRQAAVHAYQSQDQDRTTPQHPRLWFRHRGFAQKIRNHIPGNFNINLL
jgi:hypothetical protein